MAILELWFLPFAAAISDIFFILGFNTFDRSGLSASVPPIVIFSLKHAMAISLCHSSHYAIMCRRRPFLSVPPMFHVYLSVFQIYPFPFPGSLIMSFGYLYPWACFQMCIVATEGRRGTIWYACDTVDCLVKVSMCFVVQDGMGFYPGAVLLIAMATSTIWAAVFDDEELLKSAKEKENPFVWERRETMIEFTAAVLCAVFVERESSWVLKKMVFKRRKLIKFAAGLLGTVLFQNYFRLTSFDHVVAFLYLSAAWLGVLSLLRPVGGDDLGIFNFLLSNTVVGCTVSQYGLGGSTWVAYGASILLYGLRQELQRLSVENTREDEQHEHVWVNSGEDQPLL